MMTDWLEPLYLEKPQLGGRMSEVGGKCPSLSRILIILDTLRQDSELVDFQKALSEAPGHLRHMFLL